MFVAFCISSELHFHQGFIAFIMRVRENSVARKTRKAKGYTDSRFTNRFSIITLHDNTLSNRILSPRFVYFMNLRVFILSTFCALILVRVI